MGCDIHLHAEIKIHLPGHEPPKPGAPWEHYGQIGIPRSYELFARMAGVRNYDKIEPMVPPRGLPEDISNVTLFDWNLGKYDWHTPSWLHNVEIAALSVWWRERCGEHWLERDLEYSSRNYLFGNGYGGFAMYPDERPKGLLDVRWVFWFDN